MEHPQSYIIEPRDAKMYLWDFKPASSAIEMSYIIEILDLARVGVLLSRQLTKRC